MALPALEPPASTHAPPAPAPRPPGRPALYAHHLRATPIVESPSRLPRHVLRELARLAFVAGVAAAPIAVLLRATS